MTCEQAAHLIEWGERHWLPAYKRRDIVPDVAAQSNKEAP